MTIRHMLGHHDDWKYLRLNLYLVTVKVFRSTLQWQYLVCLVDLIFQTATTVEVEVFVGSQLAVSRSCRFQICHHLNTQLHLGSSSAT